MPRFIQQIKEIPMNANGKLDVLKLPKINLDLLKNNKYVEPRNEKEQTLSLIFKEVLNVDKIGIDDDFFELGGNSLKIIKVVSLAQMQNLNLFPRDLLNNHTIRKLGEYVKTINEYENKRIYNKEYGISQSYPYYYSCLTGNICEVLKYNYKIDVKKSLIEVGELGKTIFSFGNNRIDMDYRYLELPIENNSDFRFVLRNEGINLSFKLYEKYESMEEDLINDIKKNKISIISGTTYYLPYTNEYKIDVDKWKEEIESRSNYILMKQSNGAVVDHTFLLIDKIDDNYLIYDTTYNNYGVVNKFDFRKSLEGISNMDMLGESYVKNILIPLAKISVECNIIESIGIKEIALEVLKNIININLSNKVFTIEGESSVNEFKLGIESILQLKDVIIKELIKNNIDTRIIELIKECFNGWKFKAIFMRDFIQDIKVYSIINEDNIVNAFEDVIEKCNQVVDRCEQVIEENTINMFLKDVIYDTDFIYNSNKKVYMTIKNLLKEEFCI